MPRSYKTFYGLNNVKHILSRYYNCIIYVYIEILYIELYLIIITVDIIYCRYKLQTTIGFLYIKLYVCNSSPHKFVTDFN